MGWWSGRNVRKVTFSDQAGGFAGKMREVERQALLIRQNDQLLAAQQETNRLLRQLLSQRVA